MQRDVDIVVEGTRIVQVAPQVMPAGLLDTLPLPVPLIETPSVVLAGCTVHSRDVCGRVSVSGVLSVTNTSHRAPIPGLKGTQDYLGINYYGRFYVKTDLLAPTKFQVLMHDPETPEVDKPNDLGWASYPRGFGLILQRAGSRYRLPIYVLENGTADAADDDRARQRFLVEHLREPAGLERRQRRGRGVDLVAVDPEVAGAQPAILAREDLDRGV